MNICKFATLFFLVQSLSTFADCESRVDNIQTLYVNGMFTDAYW